MGCGHGIVARSLASNFKSVVGTDPSEGMIKQANESTSRDDYPNVTFRQAAAEQSPFIESGSVDVVVVGQAAHWFDYPKFFKELNRIMRPGGTLACFGYKDHVLVDYTKATELTNHYAYGEDKDLLGPYWSQPGRSIVQHKLRAIKPPEDEWKDVQRMEYEPGTKGKGSGEGTMYMNKRLKVGECKAYIRTWSAYHGWKEAHPHREAISKGGSGDLIDQLFSEIADESPELGNEETEIEIEWGSALVMARRKDR